MITKRKVLIVDDDEMTAELISLKLREKGFDTSMAGVGLSALQQISHDKPDLIILDIMMPGLSGLETLNLIRRDFTPQQIPVIIVSYLGVPEIILTADKLGATDYLVKPFEAGELVQKVENYFADSDSESINIRS